MRPGRSFELRSERTATAHQQGRRPLSKNADGARRALHSGALWTRQRSAALQGLRKLAECGGKNAKKRSGGCGGTQVSGSTMLHKLCKVSGEDYEPLLPQQRYKARKAPWRRRLKRKSRAQLRRVQVTATKSWPSSRRRDGSQGLIYQVAAPAEMRTPNLPAERKSRSTKSADGRMATEAARLKRQKSLIRKRKTNLTRTGLLMEGVDPSFSFQTH